jgi:hypothetical protein
MSDQNAMVSDVAAGVPSWRCRQRGGVTAGRPPR